MKTFRFSFGLCMAAATLAFVACTTTVNLSSWKNPEAKGTVSKLLVMAVFDKMNVIDPIETQCVNYFGSRNLPSIRALDVMNPFRQYTQDELRKKLDSLGADGFLLITYKSTDVNLGYQQGFYGGYRGYWGGGGNYYIDKTYNLRAMLYTVQTDALVWSGDLSIPDPNDVTSAAQQLAQTIFNDWVAKQLLKNPPPPATK